MNTHQKGFDENGLPFYGKDKLTKDEVEVFTEFLRDIHNISATAKVKEIIEFVIDFLDPSTPEEMVNKIRKYAAEMGIDLN